MNQYILRLVVISSMLLASTSPAAGISAAADVKSRVAREASSAAADDKSALSTIRGSSDSTPHVLGPTDVKQCAADARNDVSTIQAEINQWLECISDAPVPFAETNMQILIGETTGLLEELQRIVGDYLDEYRYKTTDRGHIGDDCYLHIVPLSNGRIVSVRHWGPKIKITNMQERSVIVLEGHTAEVHTVTELPNGTFISRSVDGECRVWRLEPQGLYKCKAVFPIHANRDSPIVVLPRGRIALQDGYERVVILENQNQQLMERYQATRK